MPSSHDFHRDYLVRLPLPIAQLYSRAHNAKDGRGRHDNCFYLFEALIKLAGCPLIAAYLDELRRGGQRSEALDKLLVQLSLPSLGQWVGFLRELARHFGTRADAASHPVGHIWEQLNTKHRDTPGMLELYRRIKNGPDGKPAGAGSVSILQLIDSLVQYRNTVFGHGAGRIESFYEDKMGPLLFPAVNEALAEGVFDFLGPSGTRLVFVTDIRTVDEDRQEAGARELVGLHGERLSPLSLNSQEAEGLLPDRVAVLWPGRKTPLLLDPLLSYRENELSEELLFLNRDRNGKQVEYLSYTTGRTERDKSMAPAMAKLMSQVTGRQVAEHQLDGLQQQSLVETPWHALRMEDAGKREEEAAAERRTLGDYELLTELGRGGMGVVYLARQLSLGRLVGLKMLPAELAGDDTALARFRREMRALGRCEHANIVKVLSSGTMPDGQLYYAMEYVPGADLEQVWREVAGPNHEGSASDLGGTTWQQAVLSASSKRRQQTLDQTKSGAAEVTDAGTETAPADNHDATAELDAVLPPLPTLPSYEANPEDYARRVARMIRDAALAVQSVHDQGIIHRDIKPANLMLTPDGSRVVLMDFGLAKGHGMSVTATQSSGFLGTLRYAAPEQLASASMTIGPQADVRALGVTLWELLTRQRLFGEAEDERQLTSWVLTRDVPRLREVDSTIDPDLEAIVAKATARGEEERIQTARELADYVDLFLDGRPLPIRNPSTAEAIRRALFSETRFKEALEKWSRVFIAYGMFFFVLGIIDNIFVWTKPDFPWAATMAAIWIVGIVVIAWLGRFRTGGPLIYVERQVARIWLMYIAGLAVIAAVMKAVFLDMGEASDETYRLFFPVMALTIGVGFGCTATLLGGSFYLPGIVCAITAGLMVVIPEVSPILFGTAFSLCLLLTGLKYKLKRGVLPSDS